MKPVAQKFEVLSPSRVDLAGGTLDLWPLYCLTGAAKTINLAISLHAVAAFEVGSASEFSLELTSQSGETFRWHADATAAQIAKLPLSVKFPAWVITEYLRQKPLPPCSVRIALRSQVPLKSGLGGSSALCVAITRGLGRIFGDFVDQGWQWEMLSWVKDVEASYLKTPTGTQDYLASLFGGLKCYVSRVGAIDCVPYGSGVFEALAERIVVLFSGEQHESGLSNWEIYKGAIEGNRDVHRGLENIRQIAETLDAELRGHISWKHIGKCLSEEWAARRDAFHVDTPRLEEMLQFLHKKKVFGAKVCGAAQGGSILALVEPAQKAELVKACEEVGIQVLRANAMKDAVNVHNL